MDEGGRLQLAVLISGRGSNMQALIEHSRTPGRSYRVTQVICDQPAAAGLAIARDLGVATRCLAADQSLDHGPPGRISEGLEHLVQRLQMVRHLLKYRLRLPIVK